MTREERRKILIEMLNENDIDSFIKPENMNTFDFDKAIAGEPIYCNGERIRI